MDSSVSSRNLEFDISQYQDSTGRTLCKVCDCILTLGCCRELYEVNLLNHIKGKKHRNLKSSRSTCIDVSKVYGKYNWDDDLNPVKLMNIGIFIINNDVLYCHFCKCYLPDCSNEVESSISNIKIHISGSRHAKHSAVHNYSDSSNSSNMLDLFHGIEKLYISFRELPKQYQFNYKYFVVINVNAFKCIICNYGFFLLDQKTLIDHLTGHDHLQQLEKIHKSSNRSKCRKSDKKVFEPVIDKDCLNDFTNDITEKKKIKDEIRKDKIVKLCKTKINVLKNQCTSNDVFVKSVPNELQILKKLIVNRENYIVCILCNILISGLKKYKTAVSSVVAHLTCNRHLKLSQYEYEGSNNSTDCLAKVFDTLPATLKFSNLYFKENINGFIICFPCAKEFKHLNDIKGIEKHLIGKKHEKSLGRFKKHSVEDFKSDSSFNKLFISYNNKEKSVEAIIAEAMIAKVFDELPLDMKSHRKYISSDDSDGFCKCSLCLRDFEVGGLISLKNSIYYHLKSTKHLKMCKNFSEAEISVPKSQYSLNDLFLNSIPNDLQIHKKYIVCHTNYITCVLCNIQISDSKKYKTAVTRVIAHLMNNHHLKLTKFDVSCYSSNHLIKIFDKLPAALMFNGIYFKENISGSIICFPCAKEFKNLNDINSIKGHLICEKHKRALNRFKKNAVGDFEEKLSN